MFRCGGGGTAGCVGCCFQNMTNTRMPDVRFLNGNNVAKWCIVEVIQLGECRCNHSAHL